MTTTPPHSYTTAAPFEAQRIYTLLRTAFPSRQIRASYDANLRRITLTLTSDDYLSDPLIPVDFDISIIYGDTDSIFLKLQSELCSRNEAFRLGHLCADRLTKIVFNREPIEMEFEKLYQPLVLLCKKKYIGQKYDDMRDPQRMTGLTTAGIAVQRRDYCEFVRDCYRRTIDAAMSNCDPSLPLRADVATLIAGRAPPEMLTMTTLLRASYKCQLCNNKRSWSEKHCKTCHESQGVPLTAVDTTLCGTCKQPLCLHQFPYAQATLAQQHVMQRLEIRANDRLAYIYTRPKDNKRTRRYECVDTVDDVLRDHIPYNVVIYLESLLKTLLAFLKEVLPERDYVDLRTQMNAQLKQCGGAKLKI